MADFWWRATSFKGATGMAMDGAFKLTADGNAEFGESAAFGIERAGLGSGMAERFISGKGGGKILGEFEVATGKFIRAGRAGSRHQDRVAQALRDCKQLVTSRKNMKFWSCSTGVLAVGLLFAGGCVSEEKEFGESIVRLAPVEPPTFLNAELAGLFGAANFSARIEAQRGFAGARPAMAGELSGSNGSLFFISDEQRGKRGVAGGLSALWNGPSKTAYLLNEPLQAYAPIRSSNTNALLEAADGEELINGDRCRKTVASQQVGSESVPRLIVWRSIEKQDFPVRIQTTNNTQNLTLTLSRVRMQAPPAELFALPSGFKAYESTDAMMAELVRRRTEAMDARSRARRSKYGDSQLDDDSMNQVKPTRPY